MSPNDPTVSFGRPISAETVELLTALCSRLASASQWPRGHSTHDLLSRIGGRGEAGAVRDLLPLAISGPADVRRATAETILRLVEPLLPDVLPVMDEWLRVASPWSALHRILPEATKALDSRLARELAFAVQTA